MLTEATIKHRDDADIEWAFSVEIDFVPGLETRVKVLGVTLTEYGQKHGREFAASELLDYVWQGIEPLPEVQAQIEAACNDDLVDEVADRR